MNELKFKRDKRARNMKKSNGTYYSIYWNELKIGKIDSIYPYKVMMMVERQDSLSSKGGTPYKWITLQKESKTVECVKSWIIEMIENIFDLHKIYFLDENVVPKNNL